MSETDTVLGYLCQKAEAEFRGRKWYAWFSMEIPYNFGPWKLGGLPGMILKAEDSEKLFSWVAVGLQQPENRYIYDYAKGHTNTIIKCKRKDLAKLWQRRWVNPVSIGVLNGSIVELYEEFPDGTIVEREITMGLPDVYYPRLELDM